MVSKSNLLTILIIISIGYQAGIGITIYHWESELIEPADIARLYHI